MKKRGGRGLVVDELYVDRSTPVCVKAESKKIIRKSNSHGKFFCLLLMSYCTMFTLSHRYYVKHVKL